MTGAGTTRVDMYGHADCSLCATALGVLEPLRDELGFVLVEHDIRTDDRLLRAYFERVPVVCVDGEEVFDFQVDEAVLRERVARARAARAARVDDLESGR